MLDNISGDINSAGSLWTLSSYPNTVLLQYSLVHSDLLLIHLIA